jgi:hypothetical protein
LALFPTQTYIQNSYAFANGTSSTPPGSVGHGIGLAFALWIMQSFGAVIMQQFLQRGLVTGFLLRASLISAISRKSLRLDVSRILFLSQLSGSKGRVELMLDLVHCLCRGKLELSIHQASSSRISRPMLLSSIGLPSFVLLLLSSGLQ